MKAPAGFKALSDFSVLDCGEGSAIQGPSVNVG